MEEEDEVAAEPSTVTVVVTVMGSEPLEAEDEGKRVIVVVGVALEVLSSVQVWVEVAASVAVAEPDTEVVAVEVSSLSPSSSVSQPSLESPLLPLVVVVSVSVPLIPPLTPVASNRRLASSNESQTMLVPFLLTRGRATQLRFAEQGVKTHFSAMH